MNIRTRLRELELRVKPPTASVCTYRNQPDLIGDWIRAHVQGDEEARKRVETWKDSGVCNCEDCRKRRRENDADPKFQEIRRFLEARYGKYDTTTHVVNAASRSSPAERPGEPADNVPAVPRSVFPHTSN